MTEFERLRAALELRVMQVERLEKDIEHLHQKIDRMKAGHPVKPDDTELRELQEDYKEQALRLSQSTALIERMRDNMHKLMRQNEELTQKMQAQVCAVYAPIAPKVETSEFVRIIGELSNSRKEGSFKL
jgi:predicted  nucleic acid-binding Zn-ribbon protein